MKRLFLILAAAVVLSSLAFADKSRFYEGGKVIDTMYVDSEDGLRARDFPSLKSARLCALPHRLPVKVVAVGREETIDGMTAPWVEILLPRYEWKGEEVEYGWVFGGYLSGEKPAFIKPQTARQLEEYLKCGNWTSPDTKLGYGEYNHFNFYTKYYEYVYSKTKNFVDSGKAWFYQNNRDIDSDNQSTWKAINNHQIEIHWFIPESANNHNPPIDESEILEVQPVDESRCFINGNEYLNKPFVYRLDWFYDDVIKMPLIYKDAYSVDNKRGNIIKIASISLFNYFQEVSGLYDLRDKVISGLIKHGVSAKGTEYEREYHDYWNPIMAEHQKKADEMK